MVETAARSASSEPRRGTAAVRSVSILGATGSIGQSTLDLIGRIARLCSMAGIATKSAKWSMRY